VRSCGESQAEFDCEPARNQTNVAGCARARLTPPSKLTHVSQELSPGAQTIVDERTQERPDYRVEEGDHERFSHYVPKDKLTEAMVMGTPVVALCGKVWVPSRDPERFPVCPECKEIWESLEPGDDDA
jgi:Protein of unknown function (DUF3039)